MKAIEFCIQQINLKEVESLIDEIRHEVVKPPKRISWCWYYLTRDSCYVFRICYNSKEMKDAIVSVVMSKNYKILTEPYNVVLI